MLTLYFDTNVFDSLYRRGVECPETAELERAIRSKKLRVSISVDVLDETAEASLSDPATALGRLMLIERLYDQSCEVLPAGDLLRNGIVETLNDAPSSSPFSAEPMDISILCHLLADRSNEFAEIVSEQSSVRRSYAETLKKCRNEVRTVLAGMDRPKVPFNRHLEAADWITQATVDLFFGPGDLPQAVLKKLLGSRPVRMHRDVLFSMYYAQSVEGVAPKDSDLVDLHHAITASVTHGIVTEDGVLRRILGRVTVSGFQVLSLESLISSLRMATN